MGTAIKRLQLTLRILPILKHLKQVIFYSEIYMSGATQNCKRVNKVKSKGQGVATLQKSFNCSFAF